MRLATLSLSLILLAIQSLGPALAMPANSDIINAINKRQFLPAGTPINVKSNKDHVFVSTYRHAKADDNDCKIDAVLIGRAVMELAPDEVTRITTYFYGKDMAKYQEVSVTAGDIKAFSTGQSGQEQLLGSLVVNTVTTQNDEDKVAQQLVSNWIARPSDYKVTQDKDGVSVSTGMETWVSDEDSKLEALRIARNTSLVQPGAHQIKVSFIDPACAGDTREFVFKTNTVDEMWKAIQGPLGQVAMSTRPAAVELQSLTTVRGAQQEAREALLVQLKEMDHKGIGVGPFVKAFLQIEQAVNRSLDPQAIATMVTRLRSSVDEQLKAYANAKEGKPKVTASQPKAPPPPSSTTPPKALKNRWLVTNGDDTASENDILSNADGVVERLRESMASGFARVEDNPKYVLLLERVAGILQKNNRAAEASKFQQQAMEIRAHKGK